MSSKLAVLLFFVSTTGCITENLAFKYMSKTVPWFPFSNAVKQSILDLGVKLNDDTGIYIRTSSPKMRRPSEEGMVFIGHRTDVYVYGLTSPETMTAIAESVRIKTCGKLQHKAKIIFFDNNINRKILKSVDYN